jgi:dTMP kinase
MTANGLFVAFEGLDGSGQTTQSKLLAGFLKGKGADVVLTKEPTDEGVGKKIRDVLQKRAQASPFELQRMFVADRKEHLDSFVEPALASGKTVITDRYFFSTLAYGGIDTELGRLREMNSAFRIPDLTFVIDVPPEVALGRVQKRLAGSGKSKNETELFEELGKLERVRENYLKVAKLYPNVHVIDGNRPIEAVAADIQGIVSRAMKE